MEEIDFEKLRYDLINYFGSATPLYSVAYANVIEVQNATDEELINIAIRNGFNIEDYKDGYERRYYY